LVVMIKVQGWIFDFDTMIARPTVEFRKSQYIQRKLRAHNQDYIGPYPVNEYFIDLNVDKSGNVRCWWKGENCWNVVFKSQSAECKAVNDAYAEWLIEKVVLGG